MGERMAEVMLEGSEHWDLAHSLVTKGMRLPLVHALTGICPSRLRNLHKSVNGKSAPPGRTPENAHAMIKTRDQAIEAAKFLNYYDLAIMRQGKVFDGSQAVNPKVLLSAYEIYALTTDVPLEINLAWYIIRDLGSGQLSARRCSKCGILYPFAHGNEVLQSCPVC